MGERAAGRAVEGDRKKVIRDKSISPLTQSPLTEYHQMRRIVGSEMEHLSIPSVRVRACWQLAIMMVRPCLELLPD